VIASKFSTSQKHSEEKDSTMMKTALAFIGLVAAAHAIELTPDNWDSAIAGKSVFIKFLAPW